MCMKIRNLMLAALCVLLCPASDGWTQTPSPEPDKETIYSMGVPSRYEFSWGPMFVFDRDGDDTKYGGQMFATVHRHIFSPLFGLGLSAEGYLQGVEDEDLDGGARLLGTIRPIFLGAGVDYAIPDDRFDFLLYLDFPLTRGGFFGSGGQLRADWIPTRGHSFNVGFHFPIGQPHIGKTRPKSTRVRLPKAASQSSTSEARNAFPADLQHSLERLNHAAEWINRYTTPYFEQKEVGSAATRGSFLAEIDKLKTHLALRDAVYPDGHSFPAEIDMYHRMLTRAFALAVENEAEGEQIAAQARTILLDKVLLPYDRLLGQSKARDSIRGYGAQAAEQFRLWLEQSSQLSDTQSLMARAVFDHILETIESQRQRAKKSWRDSEFVWLPLHYALRPDDCDEREEMNALVEQIVEQPFSNANRVSYVINEQFQQEVARMIVAAEDYHVLWIHDYRGVNAAGEPDSVSFRQTLVYLRTLTERVRHYDAVGKLPLYLICIDQWFFELNDRRWIEFLENPMRNTLPLPKEYEEWSDELRRAQEGLRQAVADSALLQERARQYGKKWLEKTVKVHVNITNPADHSFRNAQLARFVPFVPDNVMRDHRKISFYDVTESDPGKGEALYSGMGIGEQYTGATWDDRAMLVQGPVLLSLKDQARQLLEQQGFHADQIPPPLRQRPLPEDYDERLEELRQQGWNALAIDVHNQTGFGPKDLTVIKSALYTIMPAGSSILLPDGYWNAPLWGSMLTGAALRGCHVFLVAPAPENSTFSTASLLLSRTQVLFSRLILAKNELGDALQAADGILNTGIYARKSALGTIDSVDEFLSNIESTPLLKQWLPFREEVYLTLEETLQEMQDAGYQPAYYSDDAEERHTKLHYKVSMFVSEPVLKLMAMPGWETVVREYLAYRMKFLAREDGEYVDMTEAPDELRNAFRDAVLTFLVHLSEEERQRAMAYLIVGSQNHNYRSIMTDGEMGCLVSGVSAILPALDMYFLAGLTTWVSDLETLETLLPEQSGFTQWMGRYIRKVM